MSTAGLLALYPQMQLEESGAFERVARLKEEAFGRRVFERTLPGREVLDAKGPCQSCGSPQARMWGTRDGAARLCPPCATLHGLGCP